MITCTIIQTGNQDGFLFISSQLACRQILSHLLGIGGEVEAIEHINEYFKIGCCSGVEPLKLSMEIHSSGLVAVHSCDTIHPHKKTVCKWK